MKYLLLFVLAIIIVRIDSVVELGESFSRKFFSEAPKANADGLGEPPVIVRSKDLTRIDPRQQYLSYLDDFRVSPEVLYRQQAMELFKKNPTLFSTQLDSDLESRVYSWRDLVIQNAADLPLFLLDLMNILKGENKEMVVRFFSVVLDNNFEMFITSYPRSKDPTCNPVVILDKAVPREERYSELNYRLSIIEAFLIRESIPSEQKLYGTVCLNRLKVLIDQETPKVEVEETSEILPEGSDQ